MKLFEEFLYNLEHARGKSPNTIAAYKLHLAEFNKYMFNDKEVILEDIKQLHAEDILAKWLRVKEKEGLKAPSLNQRLATIKSLYKYLEGRREIQYNVTVSISQFKDKEKTEKVILSLDECKILLEVAANRVNERKLFETLADLLATQLFLGSGIRIEECSLLNIDSINVSKRELILKAEQTKGKSKGGVISLPEEVINTLSIYLPLRLEKNINIEDEDAKNALFISQKNNRLSTDQIRRRLYKIVEVAGLKHITPHALRHSYAMNMLEGGADISTISKNLRHSNIQTTHAFYIHQKKEDTSKYNPLFNPTTKEVEEIREEVKYSKPQVVKDDTNVIQLRFA
ncbi:MAG: tyrosine-type recombinase/integrase [Paraclostridium sp.]